MACNTAMIRHFVRPRTASVGFGRRRSPIPPSGVANDKPIWPPERPSVCAKRQPPRCRNAWEHTGSCRPATARLRLSRARTPCNRARPHRQSHARFPSQSMGGRHFPRGRTLRLAFIEEYLFHADLTLKNASQSDPHARCPNILAPPRDHAQGNTEKITGSQDDICE